MSVCLNMETRPLSGAFQCFLDCARGAPCLEGDADAFVSNSSSALLFSLGLRT